MRLPKFIRSIGSGNRKANADADFSFGVSLRESEIRKDAASMRR